MFEETEPAKAVKDIESEKNVEMLETADFAGHSNEQSGTDKKSVIKYAWNNLKTILKGKECLKKYAVMFCMFLLAALILELCVCNYRALESLTFDGEAAIENYTVENAVKNSDGTYTSNDKNVKINIDDLNKEFDNLYLDIKGTDPYVKFSLKAFDEANADGLTTPEREVVANLEQTKYIRTHFSGTVKSLIVELKNIPENSKFTITGIGVNRKVPLCFSLIRFLFMLGVMMFLYIFRPKSFVYKHKLDLKIFWQKLAVIAFIAVQIAFMWKLSGVNPAIRNITSEAHMQYNNLAESFLNGRLDLDIEPSEALKNMDNPYDRTMRDKEKVDYQGDTAYFNEHYYVYFGVVPVLIFYLPYKIISGGKDLSNADVLLICCILMCMAFLYLLNALIKKWFPKTSFGLYFIMSVMMCDVCGALYFLKRPEFYPIPIALGIALSCFGCALWIKAEYYDADGNKRLKTWRLALGAVCLALVAGCRPQLLVSSVLGAVLLWRYAFGKDRLLFTPKGLKNTLALCLPYVITAVLLMLYNQCRFGSPFDFGANYNLTGNDMTRRGINFDRTLTGYFYFLFQPVGVSNIFPYAQMTTPVALYQGKTVFEGMYGGFLWLAPISFFGIWGLSQKKKFERIGDFRPYYVLCAALICSLVIVFMDTQMAGILPRYYYDFAWLLMLASAITAFVLCNDIMSAKRHRLKRKSGLIKIVMICFVFALVINCLDIFMDFGYSMQSVNPELFYKMKYLIGFLA